METATPSTDIQPTAAPAAARLTCRFCGAGLATTFVDLGLSPLANSYVEPADLGKPETFHPLHVFVCEHLLPRAAAGERVAGRHLLGLLLLRLVLRQLARPRTRLRGDGDGALRPRRAEPGGRDRQQRRLPAALVRRARRPRARHRAGRQRGAGGRGAGHPDAGALLRHRSSPASSSPRASAPTCWWATTCSPTCRRSTTSSPGWRCCWRRAAWSTLEFPHLLRLMDEGQFDTIYHEHFSYFSFTTVRRVFAAHGLTLFDVEELPTHGGSLRIFARHAEDESQPVEPRVAALLRARAESAGLRRLDTYGDFADRVRVVKRDLAALPARRRARRASRSSATAPRPRATPCSTTAASRPRPARLHGRPQPPQAGALPAGHAHPHLRARAHRRDAPGLRAHPAVEPQGRSDATDGARARLGRPLRRGGAAARGAAVMSALTAGR